MHPARRAHNDERTFGERAADTMRLAMGSWRFIILFFGILVAWIWTNGWFGWDHHPFYLLNLGLSCVAGVQGAILLIAAKRSDRIAAREAAHDYSVNRVAVRILRKLADAQGVNCDAELAQVSHLLDEED